MRFSIALFILISLAFSANCLRRVYDIQISLVGSTLRQALPVTPKPTLEVDGVQSFGRLEVRLKNAHNRLVDLNSQNCLNCLVLLEFVPNDDSKRLYTSIKADLVTGDSFEDFLEIAVSENNDILGIKYGINRHLNKGEDASPTSIREVTVGQLTDVGGSFGSFTTQQQQTQHISQEAEGAKAAPQQEETFFQKYKWWLIIGGFIVFQFLTFDKEKLMEAANQQQQRGQARN